MIDTYDAAIIDQENGEPHVVKRQARAIGSLEEIGELVGGQTGTQVLAQGPELVYEERRTSDDRAA